MATKEKTLSDAFYETLKDVFYAEKQSVRALKKSSKAAKSQELKQAFDHHGEASARRCCHETRRWHHSAKPR